MLDSKAGPRACPKPLKFCPDYFLLTTEVIVRVPTRQGKVREICFFFKVRQKSGNFEKLSGNFKNMKMSGNFENHALFKQNKK